MNTTRANIINALHALENGKPAAEVTAWLQDAMDCLTLPQVFGRGLRRLERKPSIEGYTIERNGNVMSVRYPDGEEFARCVQYPDRVTVHLRNRPPVEVKTMHAAISYINLAWALK